MLSCSQSQVAYCLCCLHSGNDIAQMGRSGRHPARQKEECQMAWQSNTRGKSVMTELCVRVRALSLFRC